ncbi:hypothetical protein C8A01DRAFT_51645 [Parachaetomium inaequale]|uniref:CYTH domain-containing protein n=1 Tax=Parachaetomium inaequale TaxID=2588326 RepID=A0AAN6P3Y3_9PEZI|nr:hypothetical protein C8A01DRAFT_51645 [Parachaetomium inaequale]
MGGESPNLTPGFEIKFLLKSEEVLNTNHEFNDALRSVFTTPPTVTKINVMFMDTDSKTLSHAHWSVRIRKKEDIPNFELTYKKRYAIQGVDIDAALTEANHDGFDASLANKYEAQVEWGYKKRTLSISHEKEVPGSRSGDTTLPDVESARSMIAGEAPDELGNWGNDALREARVYGPILTTRLVGKWKGIKLTVEVWPIVIAAEDKPMYIVEASVKADTKDQAGDRRRALKELLSGRGWLCPGDSLKAQLIMDNY